MTRHFDPGTVRGQDELRRVVRTVRTRWRLRMLLRGGAIVLATAIAVFLAAAYGIDRTYFDATAIQILRALSYLLIGLVTVRYLIWPQLTRVSDERVALYLEEHEPTLNGSLLSAVEFGRPREPGRRFSGSPALVEQLVQSAVERCREIDDGKRVERPALRRSAGWMAGSTAFGVILLAFGPGFWQNSKPLLLTPWKALGISPYRIQVTPGTTTLPRGSDLKVSARLVNFDAEQVELVIQRGEAMEWERWPMTVDDSSGAHTLIVFDLTEPRQYYVEASGVRSAVFQIDVVDLPYVEDIVVEYRFPSYTGLRPQVQEGSGDLIALAGTEATIRVTPTVPVAGGRLVTQSGDTIPFAAEADGQLAANIVIEEAGSYRVQFESVQGDQVVGSPDYVIEPLSDQPPSVSFATPGRDISVTSLEEVMVEVEAQDDYGITQVDLVYSVNGGEEQRTRLYGGSRQLKDVSARHTFFLEELELEPGDFLSYFAQAQDGRRGDAGRAITDIYFMEVRPFDRTYRQADQQPGTGMGSVGGELSERQRQIIAATFRLVRDRNDYTDDEFREHLSTVTLSQGRLREEVATLVERLRMRGVAGMDSAFAIVAEALPQALVEMEAAEVELGARKPKAALSPEQRALQQLQRAEAAYREFQVGFAEGGGAPGESGAISEELADLFELELDRMRNQYEQVERGNQRAADERIDETLEKLRELARRQQQENERLRARAQAGQAGAGGGGQRRLADEVEEQARRLERLAREEAQPELAETARQLREAAEAMRRAASAQQSSGGVAQGGDALDRLREARRRLERNRAGRVARDAQDALDRTRRLLEQQDRMIQELERLDPADPRARERLDRMVERKGQMAEEVGDVEQLLDQAARDAQRGQEGARDLAEAAGAIRDHQLREKLLYSRGVIQGRSREYARTFENQIKSDLEDIRDRIENALGGLGTSREQRLEEALDRAHDAVTGLESLGERIRQESAARDSANERRMGAPAGDRAQAEPESDNGQEAAETGGEANQGGRETAQEGGRGRGNQPGAFSEEAVRQWSREFTERRRELSALRDQLRREGIDTGDLDRVISGMRDLGQSDIYEDRRTALRLQQELLQGLKEFEYRLRRTLTGPSADQLQHVGNDKVPRQYREMVEEYYRALAGGDRR